MLSTTLRLAAIVCSVLIGLGWALFAINETRSASATTAKVVSGGDPATYVDLDPEQERQREDQHSKTREYVDDANDVLLAPFSAVTADSDNKWVRRTVPALLGLIVFGFGLGFLARFASGRA